MKIQRISRNISIILRTERMIARRWMAIVLRQSGLYAFAALVSLIGLVMLNLAAFYALETVVTPAVAALIVALGNIMLAAVLVLIASRLKVGDELEPAIEMRDMAIGELEAEAELVAAEVQLLSRDVRRMARDPLGAALPALIGPLLSILTSGRKKK